MAGKSYQGKAIDVSYDAKRCIHAAECVTRLGAVFNSRARPWIQPDNAEADTLAAVITRCPSGALHYHPKESGEAEAADATNTVRLNVNGPLYVRGNMTLLNSAGDVIAQDSRMALCRCGKSENKPFCDNRHKAIAFEAPGTLLTPERIGERFPISGKAELTITPSTNGPLEIVGDFELLDADGKVIFAGGEAALCRCGGSGDKPFCDGTHEQIDFQG